MKKVIFLLLFVSFISAPAYAGPQEKGMLAGAMIGATAGAMFGSQSGETAEGAMIGTVFGALVGAVLSDTQAVPAYDREQRYSRPVYARSERYHRPHRYNNRWRQHASRRGDYHGERIRCREYHHDDHAYRHHNAGAYREYRQHHSQTGRYARSKLRYRDYAYPETRISPDIWAY